MATQTQAHQGESMAEQSNKRDEVTERVQTSLIRLGGGAHVGDMRESSPP